ncbi:MAG: glycosyltransferase [Caulobacteraceae bacterium]|nr:glycosyltransferase [Caulobacteraceae bacterium]
MPLLIAALLALATWLYLVFANGFFWLARERDDRGEPAEPATWPAVCAVVPARDEADVIARSIGSLLAQDYPGELRVILIDDGSSDGTADIARATAAKIPGDAQLEVIAGQPLPQGWTGKLWAMAQGVERAGQLDAQPEFLLLTDADIAHAPDNLRRLVARAEAGRLVLVSLMAKLRCDTFAETMLIPAFVFFFDMLYPFGQVNDPGNRRAAAAGGCMLARREALAAAGGVEAIRTAIIDDCALGAIMKKQGPIWLGLTERAESIRSYGGFLQIGRMVARSAYAQLGYSPWMLAGALAGMVLTYLAPPLLAIFGPGWARGLGLAAWLLMAISFQPMLRFYRRSPLWGFGLPLIGALYCLFTVQSAVDVWTGKGGFWKGRAQAQAQARRA